MRNIKKLIFVAFAFMVSPALAEDVSTRTLCKMLPEYQPDQSVNYTPGADVHGQMVVPGDLNKVLRSNYDAVEIPVEYNVLQNMNISVPSGTEVKPVVAILRVYHDGRVKYNDQDITRQAQSLCALRQPAARSQVTLN